MFFQRSLPLPAQPQTPLDAQIRRQVRRVEQATFSMGCFWGPDALFGGLDGVLHTCVGYAGGETPNPTYYALEDHAETVHITFDPQQVGYEQLLQLFWENHAPQYPNVSRQYRSMVHAHNRRQRRQAEHSAAGYQQALGRSLFTEVRLNSTFYRAESYHQKYRLRKVPDLLSELQTRYPNETDFLRSTTVCRINAFLGGTGTPPQLETALAGFGLSAAASDLLREQVNALHPERETNA